MTIDTTFKFQDVVVDNNAESTKRIPQVRNEGEESITIELTVTLLVSSRQHFLLDLPIEWNGAF